MNDKYMLAMFKYLPGKGPVWVPLTYPSKKMFRQHWIGVHVEFPHDSIRAFERIDGESDQTEDQLNYNLFMEADEDNYLRKVEVWRMMPLAKQAAMAAGPGSEVLRPDTEQL